MTNVVEATEQATDGIVLSATEVTPARGSQLWKPWQPGQSGNPSGLRGQSQTLASRIRHRTGEGEHILEVVLSILDDKKAAHKDRLRAAELLLNRAYGQAVAISADVTAAWIAEQAALRGLDKRATERVLASLVGSKVLPASDTGAAQAPVPALADAVQPCQAPDEAPAATPEEPPAPL